MRDVLIAGPKAVDAATVTEALRRSAATHPDIIAVRTVDDSVSLTWAELLERVDAVAGGLAKLGVQHGECVAIMLGNRPEFHIVDLAAATIGATPFSIYNTYPAAEIAYLCTDAAARVAIIEQAYLPVFMAARASLPKLEHVIVVDGEAPEGTLSLAEVEGSNPDFDAVAAAAEVQPDDVLTLIYTSGTTGHPKGVQLTHKAIMFCGRGIAEIVELDAGARVISWLPSAHIAERMAHHYAPVMYTWTTTCCPDPRQILAFLPHVRPSWFFAVPRIWEKLKASLDTMLAAQTPEQRAPIEQALSVALRKLRAEQKGEAVPAELAAQVAQADATIFSGLRAMLGLDEARVVNVGAAPTPVDVLEFFHALGIELAEVWGMSETCGFGSMNRPGAVRIGTVGQAAPGVALRTAEDGEILCRGGFLMAGYRNAPEKTAEAIDSDGWLHTGDIGEIDADGYLKVVDRKKELIINAAGKNMSPVNIEAALKSGSPLIAQAAAIGDARPYNTALVVLDVDYAPVWAAQNDLEGTPMEELAREPKLIEAVQAGVDQANTHLARVEQIKKFFVVPGDWLPGGDELTPTMKLKRKPIAAKYEAVIAAMYAGL
ncbi:MAG: AMP-dependent synthetase/ligase [Solirubrobacteraceae bacterium]